MNDYLTLYQNHIDKIKPAGSNDQYIGSCLKHEDKNPSFTFNTESGLFHCFSCEFSGNAYQFAQSVGINPKPYRNGIFQNLLVAAAGQPVDRYWRLRQNVPGSAFPTLPQIPETLDISASCHNK